MIAVTLQPILEKPLVGHRRFVEDSSPREYKGIVWHPSLDWCALPSQLIPSARTSIPTENRPTVGAPKYPVLDGYTPVELL